MRISIDVILQGLSLVVRTVEIIVGRHRPSERFRPKYKPKRVKK